MATGDKNYYEFFEISPLWSHEQIKKHLAEVSRFWTTKTNAAELKKRHEAELMIQYLDEAGAILLDPVKRKTYDEALNKQKKRGHSKKPSSSPARRASHSKPETSCPRCGLRQGVKSQFCPACGFEFPIITNTEYSQPADSEIETQEHLIDLGWSCLVQGDIAGALKAGKEATWRCPDIPQSWAVLAQAFLALKNYEEAIQAYERAIRICPHEATYYHDIGTVYESAQRFQEALQQYQRAVQLDSSVFMYRAAVGRIFVKTEMYQEGIEILEQCVREESENSDYHWFLAIAYADSAYNGWTYIGDNHHFLGPGYYATTYKHVAIAQDYLNKAISLKFDDAELMAKLQQTRQDIDAMTSRKFVGNWFLSVIYAVPGLLIIGETPIGLFMIVVSILYIISSFAPIYRINERLVQGKTYRDFGWLYDNMGDNPGCLGLLIFYGVILLGLPVVTISNFVKNYANQ